MRSPIIAASDGLEEKSSRGRPENEIVVDAEPLMNVQAFLHDLERVIPEPTLRQRIFGLRCQLRDSIARRERVA
jgi:hypothetical protein